MTTAKQPVPIDLGDGRDRALLFTGPAICRIEKAEGDRSIFSLILREAGVNHLSVMVWGGLLWQTSRDPATGRDELPLTLDQVRELVLERFAAGDKIERFFRPVFDALVECGLLVGKDKANGADPDPTLRATASPPPSQPTTV